MSAALERVLRDFRDGKTAALARAVSMVENHRAGFDQLLAQIHPLLGRARRIGITGPPGAGRMTTWSVVGSTRGGRGKSQTDS